MKNKFKIILSVMIGILIGIVPTYFIATRGANTIYNSDVVYFDNEGTSLEAETVQEALNELYDRVKNNSSGGCPSGYHCYQDYVTRISQDSTLTNIADAYRYTGATANNHVTFNGEDWRIIGVYDGKLKIMRAEPLSEIRVYNSSTPNPGWSSSGLYTYLNQETSGGYYYGLTSEAKNMIDTGTWNAGAAAYNATAPNAYSAATGTTATGKVGLVASYEYLYAADSSCWTVTGDYTNFVTNNSCQTKDWMYRSTNSSDEWTLSPSSSGTKYALSLLSNGLVDNYGVANSFDFRPAVYLKSTVAITGGNGGASSSSRYTLELQETN